MRLNMEEKVAKYTIYLNSVKNILDKYFEDQKEYIKCRAKCSYCCEGGAFPASEIEYSYVKLGFDALNVRIKSMLRAKSLQIYERRFIHMQQGRDIFDFTYSCPFLIEKQCAVYNHRPLICRIHGIMNYEFTEEGQIDTQKVNMPCCTPIGLNYAEVWDVNTKSISEEKAKSLGKKTMPKVFTTSYSKLLDEMEAIGHGDIRMLFEWILLDIPDYQQIIEQIKSKKRI